MYGNEKYLTGVTMGIDPTPPAHQQNADIMHGTHSTHSVFIWEGEGGGGQRGGQNFIWGGGQEDGIAMKGAQSKVKWGGGGNGGPMV